MQFQTTTLRRFLKLAWHKVVRVPRSTVLEIGSLSERLQVAASCDSTLDPASPPSLVNHIWMRC